MGSLWSYRYRPMRIVSTTSTRIDFISGSFPVARPYAAAQRASTGDVEKISPKGKKLQLYFKVASAQAPRDFLRNAKSPNKADSNSAAPAGIGTADGEFGVEPVRNVGKGERPNGDVKSGELKDAVSPDA